MSSDTLGMTLVLVFYYLALKKEYQALLRDELRSAPSLDIQSIQTLPILQSVITETLRLHPPVPTGGLRDSGPNGLAVAGQWIPPGTTVCVARYTIARRESCFDA